jgi:eukaryotic-like serine/threonine-protein kinase
VAPPQPAAVARSRSLAPVLLAGVVVAAITAGIALLALADRDVAATRQVPDVTNASVDDAITYLEGAGLDVDVEQVPADAAARTVVASEPGAGQAIVDGGTVTLSVSSGPTATTASDADEGGGEDGDGGGKPGRGRGKKDD